MGAYDKSSNASLVAVAEAAERLLDGCDFAEECGCLIHGEYAESDLRMALATARDSRQCEDDATVVERLIEALFTFADDGEEVRVGDYAITSYTGKMSDDDGWLALKDGNESGMVYADFNEAVRAALAGKEPR